MPPSTKPVGSNPTRALSTTQDKQTPCLFIDKFPLEIRLEIYRYLLVGRYTKRELNMKSGDYNEHREIILEGPDHTYDFSLSVLGVNRHIRSEAMDVFHGENCFVSLRENFESQYYSVLQDFVQDHSVPVLAQGDNAHAFFTIGLSIDFDVIEASINTVDSKQQRTFSVIMLEDLPVACKNMQQKMAKKQGSQIANINITINAHGSFNPERLLDPLRRIRGADNVQILGPVTPSSSAATIAAMCGRGYSANETMGLVGEYYDKGDKFFDQGDMGKAIDAYKTALLTIRRHVAYKLEEDEVLIGGRFHGLRATLARADAEVRLHTQTSKAYLQLGNSCLARIYVERIYGPLYDVDPIRFNRHKFPLQLPVDANPLVYSELLVMAARVSLSHGKQSEAADELRNAASLDPENEETRQESERVWARCWDRKDRMWAAEDEMRKRIKAKDHAAIKIAIGRKAKADAAYRSNNLVLAKEKYEAALASMKKVSYISALKWDILVDLTTVSLEMHDFAEVHRWAAAVITFDPYFEANSNSRYEKGSQEPFYTAHYCMAAAFEKEGRANDAIRHFELALKFDGGCHAT